MSCVIITNVHSWTGFKVENMILPNWHGFHPYREILYYNTKLRKNDLYKYVQL